MYLIRHLTILMTLLLAACGGGSDNNSSTGAGTDGGQTPSAVATDDSLNNQIVVIGDSIGVGFNTSANFPDLVGRLTGIPVANDSTVSISAEAGVAKAAGLIARFRPRYLLVLLGTNNAIGVSGSGVNGAISSLQFVANLANQSGVVPIIGTLPPITSNGTVPLSNRTIVLNGSQNANRDAINGGILGISGARIARVDQVVSLSDLVDGVHPNRAGQQKIAQAFAGQVF